MQDNRLQLHQRENNDLKVRVQALLSENEDLR